MKSRFVPSFLRTIRARLTLTYSALLFFVSALLLAGLYYALSSTIEAKPLDTITVSKFEYVNGRLVSKKGYEFQAADVSDIEEYVNYSTLQTLGDYSVIALGVLFGLSLIIGWWVAGRALRPVGRITNTAREITATDLSRRIAVTGPQDELRTLAETLDDMLDRIEDAFTAQRNLVDDVSHELRNPVAVIRANVEAVLARDDVTPQERTRSAAVVTRATERMTRLSEDLLATARARSGAFTETDVDLAVLAQAVIEEEGLLAQSRQLQVRSRLPHGVMVIADQQALARALGNVLANALQLAPTESTILVGAGSMNGWAWVAVRDDGPGIATEDSELIFDRFGRSNGASAQGHGLGLAIARQVVESHEGRITLFSEVGVGSTFVLWLPDRSPAAPPDRERLPPAIDPLGPR